MPGTDRQAGSPLSGYTYSVLKWEEEGNRTKENLQSDEFGHPFASHPQQLNVMERKPV